MSGLVRSWSVGPGMPGRQVRKVERPRPLKMSLTLEDTVALVETVTKQLEDARSSSVYDRPVRSSILNLSHNLKRLGAQVEAVAGERDKVDRLQVCMRAACKDPHLDLVSRVHLLELIELRAMSWTPDQNVTNYYKQKLLQIEAEVAAAESGSESPASPATAPVQINTTSPDWRIGESAMASPPPDQGLSMSGIKHPLDSPHGPALHSSPPSLHQASEGYRRNNAVRNSGDIAERSIGRQIQFATGGPGPAVGDDEFSATVKSSAGTLTVTGTSIDLVRTAKRVLHQYFSLEGPVITGDMEDELPDGFPQELPHSDPDIIDHPSPSLETQSNCDWSHSDSTRELESDTSPGIHTKPDISPGIHTKPDISPGIHTKPDISPGIHTKPDITYGRVELLTYGRVELLSLSKSPLCKLPPPDWEKVMLGVPSVVKARPGKPGPAGPARQLIERAVDELARQEAAKAV